MRAEALLDRLTRGGVSVTLDGDELCLRPGRLLDPRTVAEVRGHKAELLAELRRRSFPAMLSPSGKRCNTCGGSDRAYEDGRGGWTCWRCQEWRIEGCPRFTVRIDTNEVPEATFGACLSCGASIELHGSPAPLEWRRVAGLDDVQLVVIKYILAVATAIVRGSS